MMKILKSSKRIVYGYLLSKHKVSIIPASITCTAIITNTINSFVKTVASLGDDDSGIGGNSRQGKGLDALFYKKNYYHESLVNSSYKGIP